METPAPPDQANVRPNLPKLGPVDRVLLRAWRVFRSIRFGMFLLAVIGAVCIYGTTVYAANSTLGDNAIPLAKYRVFNAWWFFALLALFFVQFVISTWHVTKMSCRIWWKREFKSNASFFRTDKQGRAAIPAEGGPDRAFDLLARRFTRVHRDGNAFFAHKHLRTRLGPTIIHCGIVVILLAGMYRVVLDRQGKILSEGMFVAAEGETTSSVLMPRFREQAISPSNLASFQIPYDITVLDFDEIMHPNSDVPDYYSSLLRVRDWNTGEVTVAKLDMNHSLTIGDLQFHQAGFDRLPAIQTSRMNFDVRDAVTGERIAVTDADPGLRVQVGDEPLFLEVDSEEPGGRWRLYSMDNPQVPVAAGELLRPARPLRYTLELTDVYPDFSFDSEAGQPISRSNEPRNLAVRVALSRNDMPLGETILFLDENLTSLMPMPDPHVRLTLEDVRIATGASDDWNAVDWRDAEDARYVIGLQGAHEEDAELVERVMSFEAPSEPIVMASLGADQAPPAGAQYAVYPVERTIRHTTTLSVVNEPVVPYYITGVVLIALGAMMTFSGRYRAFYGLWDPEQERLHVALVPRFRRNFDPDEFRSLVEELSGGRATVPPEPETGTAQPAGRPSRPVATAS